MNATAENIRVSQASTNHVFRNLSKDHPEKGMTQVWEVMPYDSLEIFTDSAQRWLRDRSELGYKTLETANWQEVYDYFKGMMERAPKEPEPTPEEEVQEATQEAPKSTEKPEEFADLLESSSLGSPTVKAVSALGVPKVKCLTERLLDKKGVTYEAVREVIGGITVLKFLIKGETLNVSQTVSKYL